MWNNSKDKGRCIRQQFLGVSGTQCSAFSISVRLVFLVWTLFNTGWSVLSILGAWAPRWCPTEVFKRSAERAKICDVYDRIFDYFPTKNTVYTQYLYMVLANLECLPTAPTYSKFPLPYPKQQPASAWVGLDATAHSPPDPHCSLQFL